MKNTDLPGYGMQSLLHDANFGATNPDQKFDFTLSVKSRPVSASRWAELDKLVTGNPFERKYLSHEELKETFAPAAADFEALTNHFKKNNLEVKSQDDLSGNIVLTGDILSVQKAFKALHVDLNQHAGTSHLLNLQESTLPGQLEQKIKDVKLFAKPLRKETRIAHNVANKTLSTNEALQPGYAINELAKAYQFPGGLTGKGQVIGIIELGGKFNSKDFEILFKQLNIPAPQVIEIGTPPVIDGQSAGVYDVEVALDLQVLGAIAPGAKLVIYYGNTIAEAMKAIVNDSVNKPTIVSISWAGSEFNYSPADVAELNLLFYQAALLGITVAAASADYGAFNNMSFLNISMPSANPLVLACGGTIVTLTDDAITSEIVWSEAQGKAASGGGYSSLYEWPAYQHNAIAKYPYLKAQKRAVPDIAAHASMVNGYQIIFNGNNIAIGGTSAATPFICGLMALISEKLGARLGFINAILYEHAGSEAFMGITAGNNQFYAAAALWNPCTGLGSPVGAKMLEVFEHLKNNK